MKNPLRADRQPTGRRLSHLTDDGAIRMVDITSKPVQKRLAVATGQLQCAPATIRTLREQALPKGDALTVAQVAGIQAAKWTPHLIPLCHPLLPEHIEVQFRLRRSAIQITCTVLTSGKTGAEMEALTGVSAAALCLYDMCKAVDQTMRIEAVRLLKKTKQ